VILRQIAMKRTRLSAVALLASAALLAGCTTTAVSGHPTPSTLSPQATARADVAAAIAAFAAPPGAKKLAGAPPPQSPRG